MDAEYSLAMSERIGRLGAVRRMSMAKRSEAAA
jgi:hypothetical protein